MKSIKCLIIGLILILNYLVATIVADSTAYTVATNWITERADGNGFSISETEIEKVNGEPVYYQFLLLPQGFIIVSGDKSTIPVFAYGFEANLETDIHDSLLVDILQSYSTLVVNNRDLGVDDNSDWERLIVPPAEFQPIESIVRVGPLLETVWAQGYPYNLFTPSETPVGCVAVSMAQVMNYWKYPIHGWGSHSYVPEYNQNFGEQTADFGNTFYDWDNMVAKLDTNSDLDADTTQAIAELMYHCGVSVEMNYRPTGSGAFLNYGNAPAIQALKTYFRYDESAYFASDNSPYEWETLILNDIDLGHPIIYAGCFRDTSSTDSTDITLCHAFNIDGYEFIQGGLYHHFHLNMGTGNVGYYYLNTMFYSENPRAILNLHPGELIANFKAEPDTGFLELTTQFDDLSHTFHDTTTPIIYHKWYFGDGTYLEYGNETESITHTYEEWDDYTVSLIVSNGDYSDTLVRPNYIQVQDSLTKIYVSDLFGEDNPSHGTEENPYKTIQKGIDRADEGDTVLVLYGIYYENINISKNIVLTSEFNSLFDSEMPTIDGSSEGSVVSFNNDLNRNTVIRGLIIKNGQSEYGGGMSCINASPVIEKVVIHNNTAEIGGGIYCKNSNPLIKNSTIVYNTATEEVGGIYYLLDAEINQIPTIINTIIWSNTQNQISLAGLNSSIAIANSDIEDGLVGIQINNTGSVHDLGGNISDFPVFSDVQNYNFSLQNNSPCIDVGIAFLTFQGDTIIDMDSLEFSGLNPDMGVYECDDCPYIRADFTVEYFDILTIEFQNSSWVYNTAEIDSLIWDLVDTTLYQLSVFTHSFDSLGMYPISLTVLNDSSFRSTKTKEIMVTSPPHNGPVWYVSPIGNDTLYTGSEEYPFATIQRGIDTAEGGDTVLVGSGIYFENIVMDKNITLSSYFSLTHDPEFINTTKINGGSSGSVIKVTDGIDSTATIKGFRLTNGIAENGGGIHLIQSSPKIEYVIIEENHANDEGGGIACTHYSFPFLNHATIIHNTGERVGGLYTDESSQTTVMNSIIWDDCEHSVGGTIDASFSNIRGDIQGEGNINTDPRLNDNFTPIWNETAFSPCIDAGNPESEWDTDNTPPDMGSIPAMSHRFDKWTLPSMQLNRGWKWMSFPVLDTLTNSPEYDGDMAEFLLGSFLPENEESGLHHLEWKPLYEDDAVLEKIIYETVMADWSNLDHTLTSPQGYKIQMQGDEMRALPVSGFLEDPSTSFPIWENQENWVGYFLEESQKPFDAIPREILSHITYIQGQHWYMVRGNTGEWLYTASTPKASFDYGGMYILKCDIDTVFYWNPPEIPHPQFEYEPPEYFTFNESASYIPVIVDTVENGEAVLELGIFLPNSNEDSLYCVGAEKVDGYPVPLRAYPGNQSLSDMSFQTTQGSGSGKQKEGYPGDSHLFSLNVNSIERKRSVSGNIYYSVSLILDKTESVPTIPNHFYVNNNYPNPFNAVTTIEYGIPEASTVVLTLNDVLGRQRAELMNKAHPAGFYSVRLDASFISSGIYFIQLTAGDFSTVKKLVVLK